MTKEKLRQWLYGYDATEQYYSSQTGVSEVDSEYSLFPSSLKYGEDDVPGKDFSGAPKVIFQENDAIALCRNPRFAPGDYHAHEFVEIMYVYQGNCTNVVEGIMLNMQQGDFCFLSPDVYHLITKTESIVVNILVRRDRFIDLCTDVRLGANPISEFASNFTGRNNRTKYLLAQNADSPLIRATIEKMILTSMDDGAFRALMEETLFLQLISYLLERKPKFSFAKGEFCSKELLIVDILRYIRQNYRTVDLKGVASQFRYTPTHVCRLLHRYTGISFSRILTQIRMEKSAEMLVETELPVQEVALRNGYESVEHFHRTFKEYYRQTPRQYRLNRRPQNQQKS